MIKSRVREVWKEGGVAINAWLWFGDSFSAEIMAGEAFDSVTVDLQHGLIDLHAAVTMLQAISIRPATTPIARVQSNDPGSVMKLLDAGALGIVCPMISSRAECETFVAACRYPPQGVRSFGPSRCLVRYGADYVREADEAVITFAMIETRQALDQLDEILSVEGLDAVYVGPNDLAMALGYPPSQDSSEPEIVEAIALIASTAKKHGVIPGIACPSGAVARQRINQGFRFVTPGNQANLMAAAARAAIAEARSAL